MSGRGARSGAEVRPGLVFIDKPAGLTSHDVVAKVRRAVGTRRVGHAGTLDPAATGVLVVGVGRATRLLGPISGADKEYSSTIRLGAATTTDDAEGEDLGGSSTEGLTEAEIRRAVASFIGEIAQRPSTVSAIKVGGRRAHELVRAGQAFDLPARSVRIDDIEVLRCAAVDGFMDIELVVNCGSGTYIRALARDIGELLGVGGHVRTLRRTRVGPLPVSQCRALAEFEQNPTVLEVAAAADSWFPLVALTADQVQDIGHGRSVAVAGTDTIGKVLLVSPEGTAVALAESNNGMLSPVVVFVDPAASTTEAGGPQ